MERKKSSQTFEGTGVLVGLGLSERQARVYLALLKSGGAGARVVAGLAGVPDKKLTVCSLSCSGWGWQGRT